MKKNMTHITLGIRISCPWGWMANENILKFQKQNPEYHFDYEFVIERPHIPEAGEAFQESANMHNHADWTDQQIENYVNSPTMIKSAKELGFDWKRRIKRYNIANASIIAMYAKEKGWLTEFVTNATRRYFNEKDPNNRNLGKIDNLKAVMKQGGLDESQVEFVLNDPKYFQLLKENMSQYPIQAIPTYIYKGKAKTGFVPVDFFPKFLKQFVKNVDESK